MPELFCELLSEEIPARLQARAAADFARLVLEALSGVSPTGLQTMHGPRRIALAARVSAAVPEAVTSERGPRVGAPQQALAGFLRKHGASPEALQQAGDFWVLEKRTAPVSAASLIASVMPGLLRRFPWPKSMRWGGTSGFTWIRPLRRIVCLLDGAVVPFGLAAGEDDGHGLHAADLTEGHPVHAPGAVAVTGFDGWLATLQDRHVMPDAADRARAIREGLAGLAAARGLSVVPDDGLMEEVAGLVEWPVPLLGRIDDAFMDLPPEVMQVSMRVNQRYFATRTAEGGAAPWFAFVANIAAPDGGAAIVAGNERVLRARFADARHFWDLDRRTRLADRVAALDSVTFHAKLGTQGDRARRLARLAATIAPLVGADKDHAERAALLAKADLTTGMVGEFPELQGVMGGYYAAHDGESRAVSAAVRDHYAPRGAADAVPSEPVTIAVALADKLDQLAGFFSIGERPTGSGDPYALRRAALGVIRIIRENALRLPLQHCLLQAAGAFSQDANGLARDIWKFVEERLTVQLRGEGARHDVIGAVLSHTVVRPRGADDLICISALIAAIGAFLQTDDGGNLLAAYKRAANILRIEDARDGPHRGVPDAGMLRERAERELFAALNESEIVERHLAQENFIAAMSAFAALRKPLDAFFNDVTVNDADPALRRNRLNLLYGVCSCLNRVADFSKVEA
jgi:glycyl-tRNA synthetase beta chain